MTQGKEGQVASVMMLGSAMPPMMPPTQIGVRQEQQWEDQDGGNSGDGQQGFRRPSLITRNWESLSICLNNQMTP